MFSRRGIPGLLAAAGLAALTFAGAVKAQNQTTPAAATPRPDTLARFLAETANLESGPDAVRIEILAWSGEEDRSQFVNAWNLVLPAGARGGAPGRGGGAPGRGRAGRGARGGATADASDSPAPPAAQGRGRGAPGGRGAPPAGAPAPAATPTTPEGSLAAALQSAEGVGYLWSSESVGYSLRYAHRITQPDGNIRIVLATDRRLGSYGGSWTPATGVRNDYAFSVIELRLNAAMEGEGKASLTGRVFIDGGANTIALADYAALPVTLKNVRPAPGY